MFWEGHELSDLFPDSRRGIVLPPRMLPFNEPPLMEHFDKWIPVVTSSSIGRIAKLTIMGVIWISPSPLEFLTYTGSVNHRLVWYISSSIMFNFGLVQYMPLCQPCQALSLERPIYLLESDVTRITYQLRLLLVLILIYLYL